MRGGFPAQFVAGGVGGGVVCRRGEAVGVAGEAEGEVDEEDEGEGCEEGGGEEGFDGGGGGGGGGGVGVLGLQPLEDGAFREGDFRHGRSLSRLVSFALVLVLTKMVVVRRRAGGPSFLFSSYVQSGSRLSSIRVCTIWS